MALKKTINEKEVYARIIRAQVTKFTTPEFLIAFYTRTIASDGSEKRNTVGTTSVVVPNEDVSFFSIEVLDQQGMNHIKRGYEYLKTLPQFGDYEDA